MKKGIIIFIIVALVSIFLISIRNTISLFSPSKKELVDSVKRGEKMYKVYEYLGNATTSNFIIVTEVEEGIEKEIKSLENYRGAKFLNWDTLKIVVWKGSFSNKFGRDTINIEFPPMIPSLPEEKN